MPTKKESTVDAAKKVEANAKRIADLKCVHWGYRVLFFSFIVGRPKKLASFIES